MTLSVINNETGNTVWWDYMTDESTTTPTMWLTWLREANADSTTTPSLIKPALPPT